MYDCCLEANEEVNDEIIEGYWVLECDCTGDQYVALVVEDYDTYDEPIAFFVGDETEYSLAGYSLLYAVELE